MWSVRLLGGPRRVNHAGVTWKNRVYCFGGYCSSESFRTSQEIDVYCLNIHDYRWNTIVHRSQSELQPTHVPCRRYGHTVVVYGDQAILWGGRNDIEASKTLYIFDLRTHVWSSPVTHGERPAARDGHTATIIGDHMYVYGGYDDNENDYTTSLYSLHIPSLTWTEVRTRGDPPAGRDFHTAASIGDKIYFFGGRIEHRERPFDPPVYHYDNVMYVFETRLKTWSDLPLVDPAPVGRRSHSSFVYKNYIFILGGYNSNIYEHLNDLWRYCPATNQWRKLHCSGEPPSVRRRHASCVVGDKVITFGGTSPDGPLSLPEWSAELRSVVQQPQLMDKDDLCVLDFAPSLVALCLRVVQSFPSELLEGLPKVLREEIASVTVPNSISRNLNHNG